MRGESVDGSLPLRTAFRLNPKAAWVSVSATPLSILRTAPCEGGVAVFRDITREKANCRSGCGTPSWKPSRASYAKSEFLSRHESRVAHPPLNSILGFAQLLEFSEPDAGSRTINVAATSCVAAQMLLELINEVLDLAPYRSRPPGALGPKPVRMREALREALDLVRPLGRPERDSHRSRGRHPLRPACFWPIVSALSRWLLNLLSNAVKFQPARADPSRWLARRLPRHHLRVEVADNRLPAFPPKGLAAHLRALRAPSNADEIGHPKVPGLGLCALRGNWWKPWAGKNQRREYARRRQPASFIELAAVAAPGRKSPTSKSSPVRARYGRRGPARGKPCSILRTISPIYA